MGMFSKYLKYIICFACIAVGFGGGYLVSYWLKYKSPNVTQETVFKVYKDYSYGQMLDSLESSGAIKNWKRFEKAAASRELERVYKPGRYVLKEEMSNQDLIRMVANGWQTPMSMTFRGYVRRVNNLAKVFSYWFEADSAEFAQVLNDNELIDSLGFKQETFIGMFIPNTYEFYWTASPESVVLRFKKEYDRFWNESRLAKAKAMNFTKNQVSTLASIVAEETNAPGEWPKIAGVYMNRLKHILRHRYLFKILALFVLILSIIYISLIGIIVAIPGVPTADFIVHYVSQIELTTICTAFLAYVGIAIGNDWEEFKKIGWKGIIIAMIVITGTYLGSASIADVVLMLTGMI
mgnify:CR=1 FL=1